MRSMSAPGVSERCRIIGGFANKQMVLTLPALANFGIIARRKRLWLF
jgi:hypothetical protein